MTKFTNRQMKQTRFGFGEGLQYLGKKYPEVVVLGADISNSVCVNYFSDLFT